MIPPKPKLIEMSINDIMMITGICLDTFADGDELRPLPCSHCFHRACVDEWLLGLKSDERTFTNNCPCCRQDISPGVSMPNIALTSFSFTVDEDEVREHYFKMQWHYNASLN
jgi:Ring finger domain